MTPGSAYSARIPRPAWARVSPFPSRLLIQPAHGAENFQLLVLALTVFSGALVLIDITYSTMSLLAIGVFTVFGLRVDRANLAPILMLVMFNLVGLIALQPFLHSKEAVEYAVGTCFVAVTAIFFALSLNENALARLSAIKYGVLAGAGVASVAAILGYAKVAGLEEYFTMNMGRASGTFRDANVLGSFLVLPALYLVNDLLRASSWRFLRLGLLMVIILALFLTFSRGSWAAFLIGSLTLVFLMFLTAQSGTMRARIMLLAMVGLVVLALALAALLSVSSVAELFADRFTLQKDYDSGPAGRFGSQLRSIPHLLAMPFGYGPLQFGYFYPEDPHNAYLSAFSNYGWLGGILYLTFIASTTWVAIVTVFRRTPFQAHAIILFAALLPHLVQNFQIDTDRWRHLFMIYGLIWGVAAISRRWLHEYTAYAHHAYRSQMMMQSHAAANTPHPAE